MAINKAQLLQMAQQLKKQQGPQNEAQALEQLAESGISAEQQAQLHEVMRDKAKLKEVMSSPKAQALMRKFKMQPEQAE